MAMSKRPDKPAPRRCAKGGCNNKQPCPKPGHNTKGWRLSGEYEYTPISQAEKNEVRRQADGLCRKCGRLANPGEVDHIINVARGGKNEMSNYQLLCKRCHDEKTRKETKYGQRKRMQP